MNKIERIKQLTKDLNKHNYLYYVEDNPAISDFEFDMLLKELETLETEIGYKEPDSPTFRVGGTITKQFDNASHIFPMLSLSNVYTTDGVEDFLARCLKFDNNIDFSCEPKYDGIAISLVYENGLLVRAVTRGDGISGDVVTNNVKTIKSIPLRLHGDDFPTLFEIRGEIILNFENFEKINQERIDCGYEPFANPRNAASGTLKLQNSSEVAARKLDCMLYAIFCEGEIAQTHYDMLLKAKSWGFEINNFIQKCKSQGDVINYINNWGEKKDVLPFAIDGVVVKVNNLAMHEEMGYTSKSPRWAIAYKYKAEAACTKLISIDYQVGRTGVITPVANLAPVQLAGTIVKRATLHNADVIAQLDLRLNDYVFVEKGGEIIPKITHVNLSLRSNDSSKIEFVKRCPECSTTLIKKDEEVAWICPNENQCPPQIKGRIEHFISRKAMNIDSLGEGKIELLFDNNLIRQPADLYFLKPELLLGLEKNIIDEKSGETRQMRLLEKSVNNIFEGIEKSKSIPFQRVLFALGIRYVGENTAAKIAQFAKNIDELIKMDIEKLTQIDDVGVVVANSVMNWFSCEENIIQIKKLKDAGLIFEIEKTNNVSNKLDGQTFVISGTFSSPERRNELKEIVQKNGGKIASSLSNKTNFLIAGENMGPAKKQAAIKANIAIISEDDFLKMI